MTSLQNLLFLNKGYVSSSVESVSNGVIMTVPSGSR
jgi:hypothetical protein